MVKETSFGSFSKNTISRLQKTSRFLPNGATFSYFFSNRGVRLISLAGMDFIPNLSRISPPLMKLNNWCADWLFSFFLLYELILVEMEDAKRELKRVSGI